MLIGANLPDLDVLAYLDGPAADLAFRRGWTHGVLALLVLPVLLTGLMLLLDGLVRRLGRSALPSTVSARELLLLSAVSVLTHPVLDTLNTYGVRWLMPFDGRWVYGDALFIVDPWMWVMLGSGLLLSRRRRSSGRGLAVKTPGPARAALLFAAVYATAAGLSGYAARRIAGAALSRGGATPDRLMLSPRPATPFTRTVVAARGDEYLVGEFRWLASPRLDTLALRRFPRRRPDHPAVAAAAGTVQGRRFLGWARFPTFRVDSGSSGDHVVHIIDLRYADRPGVSFGAVSIPVPAPAAGSPVAAASADVASEPPAYPAGPDARRAD